MKRNDPIYPRDGAGGFKIPATKPGAIKCMCPLPGRHLEIFTPEETFKVVTPDTVDPKRTNPNAMWVNAKTHDVGCASPYVARTFVMASQMLQSRITPPEEQDRDTVLIRMHAIKERLLECDSACSSLKNYIGEAVARIEEEGLKLSAGSRSYENFPVVPDLDSRMTVFLIAARRCITEICHIPDSFFKLGRSHSSLDHLLEKELTPALGENHPFVMYLSAKAGGTRWIIRLRDGQEHSATTKGPKLNLHNFQLMPTNQVRPPCLFLDGDDPVDLVTVTSSIANFLLELAEGMFAGAVDCTLPEWPPMVVQEVARLDAECPVRYELTVDASRLRLPSQPSE